jgi:DNA-binding NarL/FixJ family response regulator
VCDDDRPVRQIVISVAEEAGCEVVGQAALALEALVLCEMLKPNALVLDLALIGMSGIDIIAAIKDAAPETAIIVFTAFDTMGSLAEQAGVFAVVRKDEPAKLEDALQRVRSLSQAILP